ncbi:MAG: Gfo/Idh/MocA family oxidoreductase, partial [Acidimicrobiia bacterium]|nr:Gfo/Idh/MocA family oxidoreductase [Acidimicrobiia bacterium]
MELNVGLIGVGYWGPNLLRNLNANQRGVLTHIADSDEQRRGFAAGVAPKARISESSDVLIADPDIDAVVIATPAANHYDL